MELEIEPTPSSVRFGYMNLRGSAVDDLGDFIIWAFNYQFSIFLPGNSHRLSKRPGYRRAQVKRDFFKRIWIMREMK